MINPESQDYKYVKPQPGCAIINLGDALVKLVGGRLYSGVHRVVGKWFTVAFVLLMSGY